MVVYTNTLGPTGDKVFANTLTVGFMIWVNRNRGYEPYTQSEREKNGWRRDFEGWRIALALPILLLMGVT